MMNNNTVGNKKLMFVLVLISAICILAGMVFGLLTYTQLCVIFLGIGIVIIAAIKFIMYLKWRKIVVLQKKVFDSDEEARKQADVIFK